MKSSLGAQNYSWGPQRDPQGSKRRLGEGFGEALGRLWEALGRLWEVRERAQAQRETTHPYIYKKKLNPHQPRSDPILHTMEQKAIILTRWMSDT